MKKFAVSLAAAALALCTLTGRAETADEAKTLLEQAVATFKAKGKDTAVKEINSGGKWTKGTLYVVVAQYDGTMLAHSANDKMAGKNMFEAKDAAGTPFVKDTIVNVKASGASQIAIRWANPVTKQIADATMFAKAVPGLDLYVGSVVFK